MYAKFFNFYLGTDIDEDHKEQVQTECPFCGKDNHFYVNPITSLWDCKVCGESGNQYALITRLWEEALDNTTDSDYESVSSQRHIKCGILKRAGICYNGVTGKWMVPYKTPGKKYLYNLGLFDPGRTKNPFTIYKGPTLKLGLFNPFSITTETAYITEGEWDALAMFQIANNPKVGIVAVPGAQSFKLEYFKDLTHTKRFMLMYDNDGAGQKGCAKAQDVLVKAGKDVMVLDWSLIPEAPKDVRDLLIKHGAQEARTLLNSAVVTSSYEPVTPKETSSGYVTTVKDIVPIKSYEDYITAFEEHIYMNESCKLSIAACMAIAASVKIPGEMIWGFLIGPPSCGKSTIIESFGGTNEYYDFMSKLTSTSLVSGWRESGGEDCSILSRLPNKTLLVKDFTTVLSMSADQQKTLFGLLRDVYDGTYKFQFGNNKLCEYHNLNFNMIAGVTDAIRGHNDAELGERFLRIDMLGKEYDEDQYTRIALRNFGMKNTRKEALTKATLGFSKHLLSEERSLPQVEDYYDNLLAIYAQLIAKVRTKPAHDRFEGLIYKPRPELPIRVALQLKKMFVALSWVFDESSPGERCKEVIDKIVLDTCDGFVFDTLKHISLHPGSSRAEIREAIRVDETRLHRIVKDLETLKFIERDKAHKTMGKGRDAHVYKAIPKIRNAIKELL